MVQWSDERRRQQNELQPGLGLRRSERASLTCRVMNSCRTPVNSELGARSHRVECFKLRRFFSDSSRRVSTPDVSRHTHTIWSLLWNSGCHLAEETKFNENVTLYFLGLKASVRSNSKHPNRSGNDCKCHIPSLNCQTTWHHCSRQNVASRCLQVVLFRHFWPVSCCYTAASSHLHITAH